MVNNRSKYNIPENNIDEETERYKNCTIKIHTKSSFRKKR